MTEKLKPCPFCGARLVKSETLATRNHDYFVHPQPVGDEGFCRMSGTFVDVSTQGKPSEAVERWNRRTPDPAVNVGALEYSSEKFTREELDQSFPDGVPVLFFKLLFPEKSNPLTIGELRQIGRALSTPPQEAGEAETPAPSTDGMVTSAHIERLMEAVEGECDGLAIDEKQAPAILAHVHAVDDLPQAPWPASGWAIDRIARLEAALKPFAAAPYTGPNSFNRAALSDDDFRQARHILAATEGSADASS